MACCILMATLLGGFISVKSLLRFGQQGSSQAQTWRLMDKDENNEDC